MSTLYEATGGGPPEGCPICQQPGCSALQHATSAFCADWSPRRLELVAGRGAVEAPRRLFDANNCLEFAKGDPVPWSAALRHGLVQPAGVDHVVPPTVPDQLAGARAAKADARTAARARRQTANRPTIAPEDRS